MRERELKAKLHVYKLLPDYLGLMFINGTTPQGAVLFSILKPLAEYSVSPKFFELRVTTASYYSISDLEKASCDDIVLYYN